DSLEQGDRGEVDLPDDGEPDRHPGRSAVTAHVEARRATAREGANVHGEDLRTTITGPRAVNFCPWQRFAAAMVLTAPQPRVRQCRRPEEGGSPTGTGALPCGTLGW